MFAFCAKNREKAKITEYSETLKLGVCADFEDFFRRIYVKKIALHYYSKALNPI